MAFETPLETLCFAIHLNSFDLPTANCTAARYCHRVCDGGDFHSSSFSNLLPSSAHVLSGRQPLAASEFKLILFNATCYERLRRNVFLFNYKLMLDFSHKLMLLIVAYSIMLPEKSFPYFYYRN